MKRQKPTSMKRKYTLTRKPDGAFALKCSHLTTRVDRESQSEQIEREFREEIPFISWRKQQPAKLKQIYSEKYIADLVKRAAQNRERGHTHTWK